MTSGSQDSNRPAGAANTLPGPELAEAFTRAGTRIQQILQRHMQEQAAAGGSSGPNASTPIVEAFVDLWKRMLENPAQLMQAQAELWQSYLGLWQHAFTRSAGLEAKPLAEPARGDRRFRDAAWAENVVFDLVKQSYLLTSQWMLKTVRGVEGLDQKTAQKVDFYTRQFVDAIAPSNFVFTNPTALKATLDSRGENLVRGFEHLLDDLERGNGQLLPKMTDLDAFKVGENIATSPGSVIFQNELMQLIQYAPATEQVHRRPLLIVPPWINKYYILDLRPENSFIKWAVERGYTVFVVSWVNPDARLAQRDFEDYMLEGPLAALGAIEQATGEREVNAIGYCIGGTLMGATLAYMAAHGDDRIKSCTFFAAQVDFSEAGELSVFIDEDQISSVEEMMAKSGGVLDGAHMATTFNMLRANDLIWSYVVNNYLLGQEPPPFDLLYWNSDTTRMPAKMHSFYLRKMYMENLLVQPGAVTMAGTPIDLTQVKVPVYLQASREDHIAPMESVFKATRIYQGPVRYLLAGSGHIAGVINPPAANKYQHWTNDRDERYATAADWLADATEHPGSWWQDWDRWLAPLSGVEMVPAREPGGGALPVLEAAPGSYALIKS